MKLSERTPKTVPTFKSLTECHGCAKCNFNLCDNQGRSRPKDLKTSYECDKVYLAVSIATFILKIAIIVISWVFVNVYLAFFITLVMGLLELVEPYIFNLYFENKANSRGKAYDKKCDKIRAYNARIEKAKEIEEKLKQGITPEYEDFIKNFQNILDAFINIYQNFHKIVKNDADVKAFGQVFDTLTYHLEELRSVISISNYKNKLLTPFFDNQLPYLIKILERHLQICEKGYEDDNNSSENVFRVITTFSKKTKALTFMLQQEKRNELSKEIDMLDQKISKETNEMRK